MIHLIPDKRTDALVVHTFLFFYGTRGAEAPTEDLLKIKKVNQVDNQIYDRRKNLIGAVKTADVTLKIRKKCLLIGQENSL